MQTVIDNLPAIITALTTLLAAVGALIVSIRNGQKATEAKAAALVAQEAAESARRDIVVTKDGVYEVGKQIDGRLSELMALTKQAAYAEGQLAAGSPPAPSPTLAEMAATADAVERTAVATEDTATAAHETAIAAQETAENTRGAK